MTISAIEFFAGIGGFHHAVRQLQLDWKVVHAFEIDQAAEQVYRSTFSSPFTRCEIACLNRTDIDSLEANLWWLSPPCAPFTRRGNFADDRDQRSRPLLHLIKLIEESPPEICILENVLGFEDSRCARLYSSAFDRHRMRVQFIRLCPTEIGWPNRRPRIYAVATRSDMEFKWLPPSKRPTDLREILDEELPVDEGFQWVEPSTLEAIEGVSDQVTASATGEMSSCFTRGYATSILRCGSLLRTPKGVRKFTSREIARLLGFEDDLNWPQTIPERRRIQLLGNSLSLPAVKCILTQLAPLLDQ